MTNYENPCATADVIVEKDKQILLIRRGIEPFKNKWALPGGHIDYGKETLERAATRELREETGISVSEKDLRFFGVYSEPNRDPRRHYITHVYIAKNFNGRLMASDDAREVRFFPLDSLPELAFDHKKIIGDYLLQKQLKGGKKKA